MDDVPQSRPSHIAIVMDGNGRWARSRGLPRTKGHSAGAESARIVAKSCARLGIPYLTLYAFSTENWQRPAAEVAFLMRQLRKFLVERRGEMIENEMQLRTIGRIDELSPVVQRELDKTRQATRDGKYVLTLALNYGGRSEIADACRRIARRVRDGELRPEQVDEACVAAHLYAPDLPDPDLLIRTGGEMRVSNFLLWQISYTEIYVTDVLWPDFGEEELLEALREYACRERRFGNVGESGKTDGRK